MDLLTKARFAPFAEALRPLLNRLVFYGVETCRDELGGPIPVRTPDFPLRHVHALSTAQIARIAPELSAAGFRRVDRTRGGEQWESTNGLRLTVESAADAQGADAESGILEYATLLTKGIRLDSGDTVRICALPAQLAVIWRAHRMSGAEFSASEWAEQLAELVLRRPQIRDDAGSLPSELRSEIAKAAREFAASPSALWTLQHALPDARTTPGSAVLALKRFQEIAALAA